MAVTCFVEAERNRVEVTRAFSRIVDYVREPTRESSRNWRFGFYSSFLAIGESAHPVQKRLKRTPGGLRIRPND